MNLFYDRSLTYAIMMWFLYPKSCWIWNFSVERSTESIQKFSGHWPGDSEIDFQDFLKSLKPLCRVEVFKACRPEVVCLFRVVNSSTLTLTCIINGKTRTSWWVTTCHKISISMISITHSATFCNSVPNFQKLKTAKFCGVLHYHGKQRNFPETLRNLLHKRQLPAS